MMAQVSCVLYFFSVYHFNLEPKDSISRKVERVLGLVHTCSECLCVYDCDARYIIYMKRNHSNVNAVARRWK